MTNSGFMLRMLQRPEEKERMMKIAELKGYKAMNIDADESKKQKEATEKGDKAFDELIEDAKRKGSNNKRKIDEEDDTVVKKKKTIQCNF